ncbi:MAG: PAS domain S-box protein [Kofleriaceae bacterium]
MDRLQALERYHILDTEAETPFDELAALAAQVCGTPTALVTLIDTDRQWFKARFGFTAATETERRIAFCAHTIQGTEIMVVEDTWQDARFAANPLVTDAPHIRFYAGVPLITADGHALGTLAVIDYVPRQLADDQRRSLRALGNQVVSQFELRLHVKELRERATRSIERSEALKSALIESALDCVIAMDHDGKILEFNPAAERTFGFTRADVIGQTLTDLIIPTALRAKHDAGLMRYLATKQPRNLDRRLELTGLRADGSEFPVELSITRVLIEPPVFAGFLRDITDRVRATEQLLQSQKLEVIGQLAGGIAHDFNNILTVMQCSAQMLEGSENPAEHVGEILQSIERASSLTRQLLLVSSKQPLQTTRLDLDGVVRNMVRMLRRLLGSTVVLEEHYHGGLPALIGDVGMIEQVLLNLAVNARDAMPDGGRLSFTTGVTELAAAISRHGLSAAPGRYVRLEVTDRGQGIAADVLPRIFEPFFTTKDAGKGTGLGLATVYGIVKHHRGWLDVQSNQTGTTFTVHLPAEPG